MINKIILFLIFSFFLNAEVYFVSPKGDNSNDGKTPEKAWKSIDRGQPTYLREDTKEGDKIIYVARAVQFPEKGKVKVGDKIVEYEGRTADSLLNCQGTPEAKKGTKVISIDWDHLKPGDKVIVLDGIYKLEEKFSSENKEWAGGNDGVFAITVSGEENNPIIIEGRKNAIIDGNWYKRSIFVRGNNIIIKNLSIRRGGILVVFSKNVEITQNRIYYGIHSVYVRYSENINITHNLIYDFHGAWTDSGIEIGDSKSIKILNNTIVNCRTGIRFWGKTKDIEIKRNIVSWCGLGIFKDKDADIKKEDIKDNLLWANGNVIWMHNLGKEGKQEGLNHYKGIDFQPDDIINKDPMIVSWYSDSEKFLCPHHNSICFKDGKFIGAGTPAEYERKCDYKKGENILFNGSFEFGFYGWTGKSWWSFNEKEANWEIKNEGYHGKKCLYIKESPKGNRSAPCVISKYFPINRGNLYTISFYAKGQGNIRVGFAVPSWHDGSSFGEIIKLTEEWKKYEVKIKLPDFVSDWVAVKFSVDYSSAYIDKVIVYEGNVENDDYPAVEIFYRESENGLIPPNRILPLIINNYSDKENLKVEWEIVSPYNETIDKGLFNIKGNEKDLEIRVDEGIYIFKYIVIENDNIISKGHFRFAIGYPIEKIKNRDFVSATPPYKQYPKIDYYENMVKKISSYGIGTFHIYAGIDRIKEFIDEDHFEKMVSIAQKYDINYLITLSDETLFTGKKLFVPEPGKFEDLPKIEIGEGRVTEQQLKIWKTYISEFVKKFKGKIRYYEILNEPNCFLNSDEYIKIFTETAPLIKIIDSKAQIIAGSVVNALRQDLYNKTLELPPGSFDWFSFHPYRFGIMNPEIQGSFREQLKIVKEDMKKNGHKENIFLTEEGMGPGYERTRCIGSFFSYSIPIYTDYFTEDEILWTNFAIRMYLTAFGEGCGGYNYHTLPVLYIDSNLTPTCLLKAIHTMMNILGNSNPDDFLELGEKYIVYIFSEKDKKIAVFWNKDCEWGDKIKIRFPVGFKVKIFGMFGERKNEINSTEIELDKNINYIVFENITKYELKKVISNYLFEIINNKVNSEK